MSTVIIENNQGNRFDLLLDGAPAGHITFTCADGVMDIQSTVVDPSFNGKGLGMRLVRHALDVAKIRKLSVIPTCTFVPKVILRHQDMYLDLVKAGDRERFGLPTESS